MESDEIRDAISEWLGRRGIPGITPARVNLSHTAHTWSVEYEATVEDIDLDRESDTMTMDQRECTDDMAT
jgi:hypothetical protein